MSQLKSKSLLWQTELEEFLSWQEAYAMDTFSSLAETGLLSSQIW